MQGNRRHTYSYIDGNGRAVFVSEWIKRPRWRKKPRHKGRGKVYGQARG